MTLLHLRRRRRLSEDQSTAIISPPSSHHHDPSRLSLASLPSEIHLLIASHLPYPDALALKHSSRHFYHLVDSGVRLKVAWLVSRHELHLVCPSDSGCDLRDDSNFCRGSVRRIMSRRRQHVECESRPGLGCLVYGTDICARRREALAAWRWRLPYGGYHARRLAVVLTSILVLVLAVLIRSVRSTSAAGTGFPCPIKHVSTSLPVDASFHIA